MLPPTRHTDGPWQSRNMPRRDRSVDWVEPGHTPVWRLRYTPNRISEARGMVPLTKTFASWGDRSCSIFPRVARGGDTTRSSSLYNAEGRSSKGVRCERIGILSLFAGPPGGAKAGAFFH